METRGCGPLTLGATPRRANPQEAGPQVKKQHAPPGFAFNIGDESKEGGPHVKNLIRDPNAFCDFHQTNGHATINCEAMLKVLAENMHKGN